MGTIYGNEVSNQDYSPYSKHRAALDYNSSATDVSITLTWTGRGEIYSGYGSNATLQVTGSDGATKSASGVSEPVSYATATWCRLSKPTYAQQQKTINKTHSSQTFQITCSFKETNAAAFSTVSHTFSISAKTSYTYSFSNGVASKTHWHNESTTLPAGPAKTGYTFGGWKTGGTTYAAGASVNINAATSFTAVWTARTYTISFNTKGGSAVSAITKTYNQAVTLPGAPVKAGYTFTGWSESDNNTPKYAAGAQFTKNITSNITLYACWKVASMAPIIESIAAERADNASTMNPNGRTLFITFNWRAGMYNGTTSTNTSFEIYINNVKKHGPFDYATTSGTNTTRAWFGSSQGIDLDPMQTYQLTVKAYPAGHSDLISQMTITVGPGKLPLDFYYNNGYLHVGIGQPASEVQADPLLGVTGGMAVDGLDYSVDAAWLNKWQNIMGGAVKLTEILDKLRDIAHPVGSYYWSSVSTSPATLFGGTWTQVKDKFIYAAGTKSVGSTGGEETHTLVLNEIPKHAHAFAQYKRGYEYKEDGYTSVGGSNAAANGATLIAGGGLAHNNMPPYIVAYCWRRTA